MVKIEILILYIVFLLIIIYIIRMPNIEIKNLSKYDTKIYTNIPIIVICWNNYYFVKNFVDQLKKYNQPIILLDNNSNYQPLLDYYKQIKIELGDKISIILLSKNYGHKVYLILKDQLPDIYLLSDPDLQFHKNMPINFAETFLNISNKYKSYKVGSALDLSDKEKFVQCKNYTGGKSIYDWEIQFWNNKIQDDYEMYYADIDTTFCLINNNYASDNTYKAIRIAGVYTVKHLPWYDNYIKLNVTQDEIDNWKKNNKSSSILFTCLKL